VFDWSWADAYQRHGYEYYPKWINAIPFTPCFGPRWLQDSGADINNAEVLAAINAMTSSKQISSWHCLFPPEAQAQALEAESMHLRLGCQFHWFNRHYAHFDDFLATMQSRKRKNIVKERRQVREQSIHFKTLEGSMLTEAHMALFYQLYCTTYLKRSGHKGYLTELFFRQVRAHMAEQLLLILAYKINSDGLEVPVAGSLYLRDSTTLYGRYWGCFDEYNFLHFETCYYQGIDYAIANGLQRFDGGAQGEHKLARGFEPQITYSTHYLYQSQFHHAIGNFVREEAEAIKAYALQAAQSLPFKSSEANGGE